MTTEQILEFEEQIGYYKTRGYYTYLFYVIKYSIPYIESNDVKFVRWLILAHHEYLKENNDLISFILIPITIKNNYFEIYRLLEPYLEFYIDERNKTKYFRYTLFDVIFAPSLQSQTLEFYNYFLKKYWHEERRSIYDAIIKCDIQWRYKRFERLERCINKRFPLPLNDGIIDF
jgi:hypothetical protein